MNKKVIVQAALAVIVCVSALYVAYLYALNGRYIYTKERIVFDKWEKCYIQPQIDGSLRYFKDATGE